MTKGFHMRYHFFLYYEWCLQNLRKDFIRTNMHNCIHLPKFQDKKSVANYQKLNSLGARREQSRYCVASFTN